MSKSLLKKVVVAGVFAAAIPLTIGAPASAATVATVPHTFTADGSGPTKQDAIIDVVNKVDQESADYQKSSGATCTPAPARVSTTQASPTLWNSHGTLTVQCSA